MASIFHENSTYPDHLTIWWSPICGRQVKIGKKIKGRKPFRLETFWMYDDEFKFRSGVWRAERHTQDNFYAARIQMQSLAGETYRPWDEGNLLE